MPRQRYSVPLNESLESPEGFRDSQYGLNFKAGQAGRRTANDDQILANLEVGRVGARLCVDAERRKSLRGRQLDRDFAPAAVVGFSTRVVAYDIMYSQL